MKSVSLIRYRISCNETRSCKLLDKNFENDIASFDEWFLILDEISFDFFLEVYTAERRHTDE